MLGPRGWDEVCWPVPGRTFFHDPQARQKDRVRCLTRDRDACDVQHGVTAYSRSGRDEGATGAPGPCCCRNPLSIIMCAAVVEASLLDGEWPGNPWSTQGWRLAESQALRLHQAREQPQGSRWPGRRAGRLAGWLNGTGPCCVRFRSHTSRKLDARCRHTRCTPDQRWAPINPSVPRHLQAPPGPDRAANMIHTGIQWIMSINS